jgi:GTP-binding protein
MKIIDAQFLTSATSLKDSISPDVAEVAFLGRSNVGKSSLLNSLTKKKALAKASSTPGKTKLINFFDVKFKKDDEHIFKARFVDLPGFGYAKVAKSLKEDWEQHLTDFLHKRESLRIFVHLIDSRHPDLEIDKNVDEFLRYIKKGDQIIINAFTKIDKLNQSELSTLRAKNPDGIFITNLKQKGIDDLTEKIANYLFGV